MNQYKFNEMLQSLKNIEKQIEKQKISSPILVVIEYGGDQRVKRIKKGAGINQS